ncbi:MAG: isochorismatase family protein [Phycisphaerae bacterium]
MSSSNCVYSTSIVVIDLNTQRDFCLPDGAYPVENVATLVPALEQVMNWVRRNNIPVVSSIDSHREAELSQSGVMRYAVDGSDGQRKIDVTKMPERINVQVDNTLSVPLDLFQSFQQVIFRQRGKDLMSNPKADRFLTQLNTDEFVVVGNVVEAAVRSVTLGLIARGKSVTLVPEACGHWESEAADLAFRLCVAKGVQLCGLDELMQRDLKKPRKVVRVSESSSDEEEDSFDRHDDRHEDRHSPRSAGRLSGSRSNAKLQ